MLFNFALWPLVWWSFICGNPMKQAENLSLQTDFPFSIAEYQGKAMDPDFSCYFLGLYVSVNVGDRNVCPSKKERKLEDLKFQGR